MAPTMILTKIDIAADLVGDTGIEPVTSSVWMGSGHLPGHGFPVEGQVRGFSSAQLGEVQDGSR